MPDFDMKLEGAEELLSKFSQLDAERLWNQAVPPMMEEFRADISIYPPRPPHSRYDRTHTLENKWKVKAGKLQTSLGNPVEYASYVQGPDQRWYHKAHGWKQLFPEFEKYVPKIAWALTSAVARVWQK